MYDNDDFLYDPEPDSYALSFCCQVTELGRWGGDPDNDSYRHITYEEAVAYLKNFKDNKFIISTTIESQTEARKALKDFGFKTVKSFPGTHNQKIYFHYWRNPEY